LENIITVYGYLITHYTSIIVIDNVDQKQFVSDNVGLWPSHLLPKQKNFIQEQVGRSGNETGIWKPV